MKNKNELIDNILKKRRTSKLIERAPRTINKFPLSFSQKRLWLMQQIEPNSTAYNMLFSYELLGKLNLVAFEQAIKEFVKRQEILKIKISSDEGVPYQFISEEKADYRYLDLSLMTSEQAEYEMKRIVERANGPFDFAKENLCTFKLFKVSDNRHIFVLKMHHIISDGQSIGIIRRDIFSFYEHINKGLTLPEFNSVATQYIDYSVWQNNLINTSGFVKQKKYWLDQLKDHSYTFTLPCDYERPQKLSEKGITVNFIISSSLTNKLKTLSKKQNCTLFMLMFTCFSILLRKYSGETDILIGTPVSNRYQADLEEVVGFFVNTLVIRSRIHDNFTFTDQLEVTKNTILDAFDNQDIHIDLLFDDLIKSRNESFSPIFQVMFSLEKSITNEERGKTLDIRELSLKNNETSKFDISLDLTEESNTISGTFECRSDLFKSNTIERLVANYIALLERIVVNPEQQIDKMSAINAIEHNKVVFEWNDTAMDFPNTRCVHQLFEEAANKYPQNTAIVYGNTKMSYQELNLKSNQLAHFLIDHGIGPDKSVAIGVERSLILPIAMLAVLKAGAAFVPIDLDAPIERNRHILMDSNAAICFINRPELPIPDDVTMVVNLAQEDVYADYPNNSPNSTVTSDHLVAIYYTSGTTGKPKGVSVLHKGWVNRIFWMQKKFKLEPTETVLQKTTLTFDDVGLEYFWTLMTGARVAVLEPGHHRDPYEIIKALRRYDVSIVFFVPSMLKMVIERIDTVGDGNLSALREVFSSGEALKPEIITLFRERFSKKNLHNSYGVTEVSIDSTINTCVQNNTKNKKRNISIGRPIGNNYIYILDDRMAPVPIGVSGNLYIGGVGLARDYYNDQVKTEAAFFENSFHEGRIYKTGDIAYYDELGNLYIVGRTDSQLKIRGMRVELDEIADVLSRHPDILECAVVTENTGITEGDRILVAYIQIVEHSSIQCTELRNFCRTMLPNHMIPTKFFVIDIIPLNNNGKLDKSRLRDNKYPILKDAGISPRDKLEEKILEIFSNILGIDNLNINDSFFDLGGHSIKAVKLMDVLNKTFNRNISITTLFKHATVEEIAKIIRTGVINEDKSIVLLKEGKDSEHPLFLVPTGGGSLINYYELVHLLDNITIYGFVPQGFKNDEQPLYTVEELAKYYYQILKKMYKKGPYRILGWSYGGNVAFELARKIEEAGESLEWLIILDAPAKNHESERKNINKYELLTQISHQNGVEISTDIDYEELLKSLFNKISDNGSLRHFRVRLANEVAFENYYSSYPINSDIYLLYAVEQDDKVPVPLTDHEQWKIKTNGSCVCFPIPGHHENLIDHNHAQNVASFVNNLVKGRDMNIF